MGFPVFIQLITPPQSLCIGTVYLSHLFIYKKRSSAPGIIIFICNTASGLSLKIGIRLMRCVDLCELGYLICCVVLRKSCAYIGMCLEDMGLTKVFDRCTMVYASVCWHAKPINCLCWCWCGITQS